MQPVAAGSGIETEQTPGEAAAAVDEAPEAAPRARLRITSDPAGAEVRIDGSVVGQTPLSLPDVESGSRLVRLERTGYRAWEQSIYVSPAEMPPIDVLLEAIAGSLVIRSEPSGAQVYVDDEKRGTTPLTVEKVAAGSRAIRLEMVGHTTHETTIELRPGGHVEREIELKIDPIRALALEGLSRAESDFESGRTYRSLRQMQELTGSAERQAALTPEDHRRMGYLLGRLGSGLPDVRFLVQFAGQKEPIEDDLGVPGESRPIAVSPEAAFAGFAGFEVVIRRSATTDYHVTLLQFKRKARGAVRVVPHEVLTSDETLLLRARDGAKPAAGDHRAVDSTTARPDDVLYCLLISATPPPEGVLAGLAGGPGSQTHEESLAWARRVFEFLEESEWIREENVVLRSILVKLEVG